MLFHRLRGHKIASWKSTQRPKVVWLCSCGKSWRREASW